MTPGLRAVLLKRQRLRAPSIAVYKSGTSYYIRQPYSATYDVVRLVNIGVTPSASAAGVLDFNGVRLIPVATLNTAIASAFTAATGNQILYSGSDNSPPEKFRGMYLGGGHGVGGSYTLTKTGHGLTNADVVDVGTDGAAKSWVLVRVNDANTIAVTAANTGTPTIWTIGGSITGTTITFAGAGAFAFTASAAVQIWPLAQNYYGAVSLDGSPITADGAYSGRKAEVQESYGIPNPASWLSTLIAEKGAATPKTPSDSSIDTQIRISVVWYFDGYGAQVGYFDHYAIQEYGRVTNSDYWGGQQWGPIVLNSGETRHQYVPDLAAPVGGYDFTAVADITANADTVTVLRTDCVDASNPASHFAQLTKDAGGNPLFGFVHGLARHEGVGVPSTRAAKVTSVWQLAPTEKQYIRAADYAATTVAAGEYDRAVNYHAFYDMSTHPTHTVNAVVEYREGIVHWIFDCHDTLSGAWVALPSSLKGRQATVIDGTNFTLHTSRVTTEGLQISTTGGYGRAVVRIA
jgi:hypothetical protein